MYNLLLDTEAVHIVTTAHCNLTLTLRVHLWSDGGDLQPPPFSQ